MTLVPSHRRILQFTLPMDLVDKDYTSLEPLSGLPSPKLARPMLTCPVAKQRSLLMNLVLLSHLHQQRLMLIILLESRRNSLVLVDDFRNNDSTASLVLLGPPMGLVDPVGGKKKRPNFVFSDEDSESEPMGRRWRRKLSDKVQKPLFLAHLKRDFNFRIKKSNAPKSPQTAPKSPDEVPTGDPSCVSPVTLKDTKYANKSVDKEETIDREERTERESDERKKVRSSSITQSIFLKKRMLLSKDVQLELYLHLPMEARFPEPAKEGKVRILRTPLPPAQADVRLHKRLYEFNRKWNKSVSEPLPRRDDARKRERSELLSSNDGYAIH